MTQVAQPLLISEREAAELFGVSERTMFNMRRDGQIPFVKCRGRIMFRVASLEKWLHENEQGTAK
jgi:excisionase family DNA binding protein